MFEKKKFEVQKCVYAVPVDARPEQKNLVAWVRLSDLPLDLKLDPNARRADVTSKVARQIIATLRDQPDNFWKLNSGIQMTARDLDVKDGRAITLTLHDAEDDAGISDGVINGGHTYECIKKVLADLLKQSESAVEPAARQAALGQLALVRQAVVRVEVLTGISRDELPDISRARNTGEAVKKFSLQNLKGFYEPIKTELGAEMCERIGFCENDVDEVPGKTFQVTELIRLMGLFNNGLYPIAQDTHPVICYTSAGRLVDKWETEAATFKPMIPKLKTLMSLHDVLYVMVCKWKSGVTGSHNAFEIKPHVLPFTGASVKYNVSTAFVYPLLAALRVLLDKNNSWKMDPHAFVEREGEDLLKVLVSFYVNQCRSKPHELGRSAEAWGRVASEARARFAEIALAEQQGN